MTIRRYNGKKDKECFLCGESFRPFYFFNKETLCINCFRKHIADDNLSDESIIVLSKYVEPILKKDLSILYCIMGVK